MITLFLSNLYASCRLYADKGTPAGPISAQKLYTVLDAHFCIPYLFDGLF